MCRAPLTGTATVTDGSAEISFPEAFASMPTVATSTSTGAPVVVTELSCHGAKARVLGEAPTVSWLAYGTV